MGNDKIWSVLQSQFGQNEAKSEAETDTKLKPVLASSGKLFSGEVIRQFPKGEAKFTNLTYEMFHADKEGPKCTKWAVLTTIFSPPSESIRRFLYQSQWCVVVIADKKTNQEVC